MHWKQTIGTLGLGVLMALAADARAQQEPPIDTIPWPARNQLSVTTLVRLESVLGDTIRLVYSVQSQPTSVQPGKALILQRHTRTWIVGSPKRWVGDTTLVQDSAAVIWYSVTTSDMVDPGENLTGFSIAGLGVPDIATLRVPGHYPAPLYSDTARIQYGAPRSIWVDAAEATTVGLVPTPTGTTAQLLSRLSSLNTRACELGWVSPTSVCTTLAGRLASSSSAFAGGDIVGARSEMDAYISELETRRGGDVTEDGFALLWPNAKAARERM